MLLLYGTNIIDLNGYIMKKLYVEIIFLIITNFIFYFLSLSVQEFVKKDYIQYGVLSEKNLAILIAIVLCMTLLMVCIMILILKRYNQLGLLSIYTIITTVFWDVLLITTTNYSLSWNSFVMAEGVVITSFYILPVIFAIVTLVYKTKSK